MFSTVAQLFGGAADAAAGEGGAALAPAAQPASASSSSAPCPESARKRQARIDGHLQEFSVLVEYERSQEILPPGMFVMPSFDSVFIWHGTLFLDKGLYRGGVFKFEVQLPKDYPVTGPDIRFLSKVFHPLVDPANGDVDVETLYPNWEKEDRASFVLSHLHRAFLQPKCFEEGLGEPLNVAARKLYLEDKAAFAEQAAQCAKQSVAKVYEMGSGSSLQFTKGPALAHDQILEELRADGSTTSSQSMEEKKKAFVEWFCDRYAQRGVVGVASTAPETVLIENTTS